MIPSGNLDIHKGMKGTEEIVKVGVNIKYFLKSVFTFYKIV